MTNTLIIGFSVTEMPTSYVPRLRALIDQRNVDISIDHCGIGGITPESLVYFVDRILKGRPDADRVVFEVATSHIRGVYKSYLTHHPDYYSQIWAHFEQFILLARWMGKEIAFVNLPVGDTDYRNDFLESIIAQVCAMYSVPLLSISYELYTSRIEMRAVLMDEVHPSPVGAVLYAEKILSFLLQIGPGKRRLPKPPRRVRFSSVALADYREHSAAAFQRHGFSENYAVLNGGDSITFDLGVELKLEGFSVLCGPKSGVLTIETDAAREFLCYDAYCYYERMMNVTQLLGRSRWVTFSLSPQVPDTVLLKGVKDEGPRRIGLFYLFTNTLS